MPLDENGIWNPGIDPSIYPGTAGGGNAGLSILNAFRGEQNYQQSHAAKLMALRRILAADPNAGALTQSPDADTATGLPQGGAQQMYQQTPMGTFRSYAQDNPDAQPEQLYGEQARLGMVTPTSLGATTRATADRDAKMERLQAVLAGKEGREMRDGLIKLMNQGVPPQTALDLLTSAPSGVSAAPAATAPLADAKVATEVAKAGELTAKAGKEKEQTKFVAPLAQSLIDRRTAQSALDNFKSQTEQYKAKLAEQTMNGTRPLTPKDQLAARKELATIDKNISDVNSKYLYASQRSDPATAATKKMQLDALRSDRAQIAAMIAGVPAPAGAPKGPLVYDPNTRTVPGLASQ